jgi:hypothetical protein
MTVDKNTAREVLEDIAAHVMEGRVNGIGAPSALRLFIDTLCSTNGVFITQFKVGDTTDQGEVTRIAINDSPRGVEVKYGFQAYADRPNTTRFINADLVRG